ncbi:GreA/GreB family elongation factor [Allorhodopirellula solitaria]|uniref:Regulator of nucleoside diphosphate kinase n=1 Tax=Allorhodopirellula solitaria TaxID=2527987 RepID=A0A5C5XZI6_9BACT|nr:GreA/GreB family elongation factor [Allorhodopirellula solitaria]TWT67365.1 Regulator of nucleoside diphosphate kinase [Allorhodopirellula solitaria]
MTTRIIAVTRTDLQRLEQFLDSELMLVMGGQRPHLKALREKLQRATVVESPEMLPDIVTMNSTIYLHDLDRGEPDIYTLVYPDEACIAEGKLSIFSPLGAEIFGRRVGETLQFQVGERDSHKRIDKLSFQPERVGAFNL